MKENNRMQKLIEKFNKLTSKEKKTINYMLEILSHLSAYNTEETEGTTLIEIKNLEEKENFENKKKEKIKFNKYKGALNYLQKNLIKRKFWEIDLIKFAWGIYGFNLEKNIPPIFKTTEVTIDNSKAPLTKVGFVNSHMQNFVNKLNQKKETSISLKKSFLLHYYFETIHPFNDGNGRIGRMLLMIDWQQKKLWPKTIACPFNYVVKRKKELYLQGFKKIQKIWETNEKNQKNPLTSKEGYDFDIYQFAQNNQKYFINYYKNMEKLYWETFIITEKFITTYQKAKKQFKVKLSNLSINKNYKIFITKPVIIQQLTELFFTNIFLTQKKIIQKTQLNPRTWTKIFKALSEIERITKEKTQTLPNTFYYTHQKIYYLFTLAEKDKTGLEK